jgi:hypothetical protein
MRHVALTATAVAAVLVAIVACEDQAPEKSLTAPDAIAYGKSIGNQCDDARARLIASQQADLWAKPALDSAQSRFAFVTANCSTDAGKRYMLDYVQWTINNRGVLRSSATDAMLITHWDTVFPYVGYSDSVDRPTYVPVSVFTAEGRAKVIHYDVTDTANARNAALEHRAQNANGELRDHLFVMYPTTAGCLTGTNLEQYGPCFQFSAFPHADSTFSPRLKLGICEAHLTTDSVEHHIDDPSLAHLDGTTRVTDSASVYPTYCFDEAPAVVGSWNKGLGGIMKRLAWYAKKVVTPTTAYAVHGGLGGLGGGLSPFGAVDRNVFRETFSDETIGTTPTTASPGTWFSETKSPGTVLVQSSLGTYTGPLVVLNQSGGNCKNCLGLLLRGTLFTASTAAADGIYDVEFKALQDNANMKEAVFVLRDTGGRDIARVTYAVRNNVNQILYNDLKGSPGTVIGNWVQHNADSFRIRVNLDTDRTTIWLNNVEKVSNALFVNTNAANLATISADFRGIDSGVMGWDEISIERQPDTGH